MAESLDVGSITVRLIVTDDDTVIALDQTDELSVMQKVGMLEMAKDMVLHEPPAED